MPRDESPGGSHRYYPEPVYIIATLTGIVFAAMFALLSAAVTTEAVPVGGSARTLEAVYLVPEEHVRSAFLMAVLVGTIVAMTPYIIAWYQTHYEVD